MDPGIVELLTLGWTRASCQLCLAGNQKGKSQPDNNDESIESNNGDKGETNVGLPYALDELVTLLRQGFGLEPTQARWQGRVHSSGGR
jgi:hypothetical protein